MWTSNGKSWAESILHTRRARVLPPDTLYAPGCEALRSLEDLQALGVFPICASQLALRAFAGAV